MHSLNNKEQEFFEAFLNKDEKALDQYYKEYYEKFVATILKMRMGDIQIAKEIYPECVTILYYNITNKKLQWPLQSQLFTYLIAVAKNIIKNREKSFYARKIISDDEMQKYDKAFTEVGLHNYQEQAKVTEKLLDLVGEPCKEILKLFYIKEYTAESVKHALQLNTEGAARKKKFDCLQKLRKLIQENQLEIKKYL